MPLPEFYEQFEARFGLRIITGYGSTDAGICIVTALDNPQRQDKDTRIFSCGKPSAAYDIRIFPNKGLYPAFLFIGVSFPMLLHNTTCHIHGGYPQH